MICKVSKQEGSGVVEEDEMKSIHNPTPLNLSNYYYFYLPALCINEKPKNQTTNILTKSLWIRYLLIQLRSSILVG